MKDYVDGLDDSPSLNSPLLHAPSEDYITDNIPVRVGKAPALSEQVGQYHVL